MRKITSLHSIQGGAMAVDENATNPTTGIVEVARAIQIGFCAVNPFHPLCYL